jgi:regulator of protease activity HflC (stomatin/prohibitin superfamily)
MEERKLRLVVSGWAMVGIHVVLWIVVLGLIGIAVGGVVAAGVAAVVVAIVSLFLKAGYFINPPNHAKVFTFFGRYVGTRRDDGFWWTFPLYLRKSVSLRIRTFDSDVLKVNDAAGNPVEIAAVINWQVLDTARALFDVDNYTAFVEIQTETAVRHVASEYPYESYEEGSPSLRANADDVTATLQQDLQTRLTAAGVTVLETRLRRLAYSPEIAQEMLRRQQAAAVVAARKLIVEGAVGMVDMALQMLSEQEIVDLDEERKAAMVSNLLVVLCSDRGAQPVVNSGSLYQ